MTDPTRYSKLQRALIVLALILVVVSTGTTGIMPSLLTGFFPEAEAPEFTLDSWLEGDFQRQADAWFKERFGLRDYYVRFANQINYLFFSKSYEGRFQIVVGKDRQLYEFSYLKSYCGYRDPMPRDEMQALFRRVRRVQDALEARGIAFFFLITPHKVSILPEYMPDDFCGPQESPGSGYEMALEVIEAEGVHHLDGYLETTHAMPMHEEIGLFPRGGVHWNRLGAFYTTRALLETADRLSAREIPGITIESMTIDRDPQDSDKDLADLLNVIVPPLGYEVPHPVIVPERPAPESIRAVFVGGSFLHLPMDILEETELFEQLDLYFYFDKQLTRHASGEEGPIERSEIDWEGEIFNADVVVLESNMTGFSSAHIADFLDDALLHLEGDR
jgi:hypothetical protein